MKRMEELTAEIRAPSLARSRSRGRSNPSELLARRQQLVSEESGWLLAEDKSSTRLNDADPSVGKNGGEASIVDSAHHSRSLARRAKQSSENSSATTNRPLTDNSNQHHFEQSSVEAKLESLSELLKSHQNDTTSSSSMMMLSSTIPTTTTMTTMLNSNANNNGLHHNSNEQQQQAPMTPNTAKSIDDVYILLAKKEKDLQLAAELGKALLEKNDELSKANERITEDYSHKLEVSLVRIVLLLLYGLYFCFYLGINE